MAKTPAAPSHGNNADGDRHRKRMHLTTTSEASQEAKLRRRRRPATPGLGATRAIHQMLHAAGIERRLGDPLFGA